MAGAAGVEGGGGGEDEHPLGNGLGIRSLVLKSVPGLSPSAGSAEAGAVTPCNGPGRCEVIPEQHPCPGPRGSWFCGWWLSCPVPRPRSGCFLSGRWNQRLRGEQRKENCKGQGLAVNGYFMPAECRAVPSFWQGDTGTAAIPLVLLGKLRHGLVPRATWGCAGRLQGKAGTGWMLCPTVAPGRGCRHRCSLEGKGGKEKQLQKG